MKEKFLNCHVLKIVYLISFFSFVSCKNNDETKSSASSAGGDGGIKTPKAEQEKITADEQNYLKMQEKLLSGPIQKLAEANVVYLRLSTATHTLGDGCTGFL